jgi:hypothetical protein
MKKELTCFIFLCTLSVVAIAQEPAPKAGVSVRFNPASNIRLNLTAVSNFLMGSGDRAEAEMKMGTLSADLVGRYFLKDQVSVRFGVGMSSMNMTTVNTYTSSGTTAKLEGELSQKRFTFTPAVERRFRANKLEILAGIGMPVGIIGKTNASVKTTSTDAGTNSSFENKFELDGGVSIGLQSFAGFNFYLTNKFAIGTELSYGFGYTKAGGDIKITQNDNGTKTTYSGDELNFSGPAMIPLNAALVLTMNL